MREAVDTHRHTHLFGLEVHEHALDDPHGGPVAPKPSGEQRRHLTKKARERETHTTRQRERHRERDRERERERERQTHPHREELLDLVAVSTHGSLDVSDLRTCV